MVVCRLVPARWFMNDRPPVGHAVELFHPERNVQLDRAERGGGGVGVPDIRQLKVFGFERPFERRFGHRIYPAGKPVDRPSRHRVARQADRAIHGEFMIVPLHRRRARELAIHIQIDGLLNVVVDDGNVVKLAVGRNAPRVAHEAVHRIQFLGYGIEVEGVGRAQFNGRMTQLVDPQGNNLPRGAHAPVVGTDNPGELFPRGLTDRDNRLQDARGLPLQKMLKHEPVARLFRARQLQHLPAIGQRDESELAAVVEDVNSARIPAAVVRPDPRIRDQVARLNHVRGAFANRRIGLVIFGGGIGSRPVKVEQPLQLDGFVGERHARGDAVTNQGRQKRFHQPRNFLEFSIARNGADGLVLTHGDARRVLVRFEPDAGLGSPEISLNVVKWRSSSTIRAILHSESVMQG
ncbi:MAG: hypothetical protein BWZ08_01948 [candidate division BRC1 bacterium ADurb.BinA292]|nr:MAG: hypothetical protein BWZ08_01948 [candidate division BRC1 bacterium ADurb.BinA292]